MKLGAAFHQVLVMGQRFTAADCLKYGLAKQICPASELLACAQKLALQLVGKQAYSRETLSAMKADIYKDVFDAAESDGSDDRPGSVYAIKPRM